MAGYYTTRITPAYLKIILLIMQASTQGPTASNTSGIQWRQMIGQHRHPIFQNPTSSTLFGDPSAATSGLRIRLVILVFLWRGLLAALLTIHEPLPLQPENSTCFVLGQDNSKGTLKGIREVCDIFDWILGFRLFHGPSQAKGNTCKA